MGWTPLKSLEQLGPLGVLIILQVTAAASQVRDYDAKYNTRDRSKVNLIVWVLRRLSSIARCNDANGT